MRRGRIRLGGAATALTLGIVLVACGSGSTPATSSAAASGSPPATEATDSGGSAPGPSGSSTTGQSPQQIVDSLTAQGLVGVAAVVVTPGANGAAQVDYYNTGVEAVGGSPVTQQTVFEIGSLTKVFTADLLATMVAQGKIALSDPLQKYAPAGVTVPTYTAADGAVTQVTIGDLVTHQAGLPDLPANANAGCPNGASLAQCPDFYSLYTRDMMWEGLSQTTLLSQPGTTWLYSNFGFGILGTVLADLAQPGQATPPYQSVLQSQVLSHFPLPNTAIETAGEQMATGYTLNGTQPAEQPRFVDTNALAGAGGLNSTSADLAVWLQAHLGYPVGTSAGADQPLQQTLQLVDTAANVCNDADPPQCTTQGPTAPQEMGMAWQLPPVGEVDQPWATKDGATYGFDSQVFLVPQARTGIVLLSNTFTSAQMQTQAQELLVAALG